MIQSWTLTGTVKIAVLVLETADTQPFLVTRIVLRTGVMMMSNVLVLCAVLASVLLVPGSTLGLVVVEIQRLRVANLSVCLVLWPGVGL